MNLRLDVHAFTEICDAIKRGEEIVLHGTDTKNKIVQLMEETDLWRTSARRAAIPPPRNPHAS
jgi:hypothetical protein